MARFALILAFVAAGSGVVFPRLFEEIGFIPPPFFRLLLCLPAVMLGIPSWLRSISFARSWLVVVCVLVAWLGLIYAEDTESNRGFLFVAYFTIPLPVAALIVEQRAWWLCTKTFVLTTAIVLAMAAYFEFHFQQGAITLPYRFGSFISPSQSRALGDPNQMGSLMAIASVLALIAYLHGFPRNGRPAVASLAQHTGRHLLCGVLLALGCLLSASRGAFIAWFVGASTLFLFGTKGLSANRLRDLVALAGLFLAVALIGVTAAGIAPWGELLERLVGERSGSLKTIGGRQQLWLGGIQIWLSNPTFFFLGAGTGTTERMLADLVPHLAIVDQHGETLLSAHSAFIELLATYGLLGAVPGVCMLVTMFYRARQWDVHEGTVARVALLLTVCLRACSTAYFREPSWLAPAALILAMIPTTAPPIPRRRNRTASHSKPLDRHPGTGDFHRPHRPPQSLKEDQTQSPHRPSTPSIQRVTDDRPQHASPDS